MKIAHIVCTYPPYKGGMGNVVAEMAKHLSYRGHKIFVITPAYKKEDYTFSSENLEVIRLSPRFHFGNAAYLSKLDSFLQDIDIIHLHYPFFGTARLVQKWKKAHSQIPLVITYHMDTIADGWKGMLFRWYQRHIMLNILLSADRLTASSFDYIESSQASQLFHENKNKWIELPFGVDIDRFYPDEKPRELFEQLKLDVSLPTLLFVGGMDVAHAFKGISVLLDAIHLLQKDGTHIQLVLVGDGRRRSMFERQVSSLKLHGVRFVGQVSDDKLAQYERMPDITVLPSLHCGEAFGLVLLEAMASGVPVIASDLPGVRTIARQAGYTIPAGDSQALAHAITLYMQKSDEEKIHLRQKARDVAETHYTWDKCIDKLEELYNSLCDVE